MILHKIKWKRETKLIFPPLLPSIQYLSVLDAKILSMSCYSSSADFGVCRFCRFVCWNVSCQQLRPFRQHSMNVAWGYLAIYYSYLPKCLNSILEHKVYQYIAVGSIVIEPTNKMCFRVNIEQRKRQKFNYIQILPEADRSCPIWPAFEKPVNLVIWKTISKCCIATLLNRGKGLSIAGRDTAL